MKFWFNAALAVDGIIEIDGKLVLIKRGRAPFKGSYAFPGGFVDPKESVGEAVVREVREETGLRVKPLALIGVYSKPGRDPRGKTVSPVFACKRVSGKLKAGDDASHVELVSLARAKRARLAFDHALALKHYLKWRARGKAGFWG